MGSPKFRTLTDIHTYVLDCSYFPDQERRYEFVISTSLRRCFDGFVVWTLVVSLVGTDFPQKRVATLARVARGVSYDGAAVPAPV